VSEWGQRHVVLVLSASGGSCWHRELSPCVPVPTMVARMEQDPTSDNECIRPPEALSEALLASD
jgi:hypothetical protein